jgi:hypothetical protein
VIEGNPHSGAPLDYDGTLIAAAPEMLNLLRMLMHPHQMIREAGMCGAERLMERMEGEQ